MNILIYLDNIKLFNFFSNAILGRTEVFFIEENNKYSDNWGSFLISKKTNNGAENLKAAWTTKEITQ